MTRRKPTNFRDAAPADTSPMVFRQGQDMPGFASAMELSRRDPEALFCWADVRRGVVTYRRRNGCPGVDASTSAVELMSAHELADVSVPWSATRVAAVRDGVASLIGGAA